MCGYLPARKMCDVKNVMALLHSIISFVSVILTVMLILLLGMPIAMIAVGE